MKKESGHWTSLRHNGVAFPEAYQYRGIEVKARGERFNPSPPAEEMMYAWAKKKDTQYVKDPVFAQNFFKSLEQARPEHLKDITLGDIDFSEFYAIVDREKQAKESMSKEQTKELAERRKAERQRLKELYGYAEIDGERVEVANWMVEPPGLFMGRGEHPLRGMWKPRVYPGDITLNLSEDAPIPPGNWGRTIHDKDCMWIASWVDKLSHKVKYVWPSDTSRLRQLRDKVKYDRAAKLEGRIDHVRGRIRRMLSSKDQVERKVATVCYLIDTLAMRVGDEKDEDEADTVGATTLRVEHVTLNTSTIYFDFLGKDSVRWQKTIEDADPAVVMNFREFMEGKAKEDLVFDRVTSNMVNRYLGKMMPGLTAKVFRTYYATKTVEEYLGRCDGELADSDQYTKVYHARMANLQAAIRCNHKRTPPKNWNESLERKEERLRKLLSKQPDTERGRERLRQQVKRIKLQIELAKATRDYNLNTSLKNYIDPRVYRRWATQIGLDWRLIYTKTLQRKFTWAKVRVPPASKETLAQR